MLIEGVLTTPTWLLVRDGLDFQNVLHTNGAMVVGDKDLLVITAQLAMVHSHRVRVREVEMSSCKKWVK